MIYGQQNCQWWKKSISTPYFSFVWFAVAQKFDTVTYFFFVYIVIEIIDTLLIPYGEASVGMSWIL